VSGSYQISKYLTLGLLKWKFQILVCCVIGIAINVIVAIIIIIIIIIIIVVVVVNFYCEVTQKCDSEACSVLLKHYFNNDSTDNFF
jgi:hypothetical protein